MKTLLCALCGVSFVPKGSRGSKPKFCSSLCYKKRYWTANRAQLSERHRLYYWTHREKIRQWAKKYYAFNRTRLIKKHQLYHLAHREQYRQERKQFRAANPDLFSKVCQECGQVFEPKGRQRMCYKCGRINKLKQVRAWALANPEKRRESWQRHYASHREERRESERRYRVANREKIRVAAKIKRKTNHEEALIRDAYYRAKHREAIRERNRIRAANCYRANPARFLSKKRQARDELHDTYIKQILRDGTCLSSKDFPPEIVELQRNKVRLLRAIRNT